MQLPAHIYTTNAAFIIKSLGFFNGNINVAIEKKTVFLSSDKQRDVLVGSCAVVFFGCYLGCHVSVGA